MKIKEIQLSPEEIDYLLKGNIHWDDLRDKTEKQVRKPLEPIPSKEVSTNSISPTPPNLKITSSDESPYLPKRELATSKEEVSKGQLSYSENPRLEEKTPHDAHSNPSEESDFREIFPDWKPLLRKDMGKDGEGAQVLRGKSDPNEWARRLKRLEELEKKGIEQSQDEQIKGEYNKEFTGTELERLPEEGYLSYEEETWPEAKPIFAGSKVYVLLSMMGCVTLGTWLYFVFSH